MNPSKWPVLMAAVVVLVVLMIGLVVWFLRGSAWGGGAGSRTALLREDPLFVQVNEAFADEVTEIEDPSSEMLKPTPASLEVHIATTRTVGEVIADTRALPAFEQWSELSDCSLMVDWCATRMSDDGVTLLATWSQFYSTTDSSGGHMVFRLSEN